MRFERQSNRLMPLGCSPDDPPFPFIPPRRTLMGPGPSDVPERILQAMARPTIGHLDPAFISLMDEIKELLRYTFRTQ